MQKKYVVRLSKEERNILAEVVKKLAADEIYVKDAVLMTVEPESMCWLGGRLGDEVSGEAWAQEFGQLPHLEQVTRDGGQGLANGVALVNAQRQQQGQPALVDQGDHFHALRDGSKGIRKAEMQARKAFEAAEAADQELAQCQRTGRTEAVQRPAPVTLGRRPSRPWTPGVNANGYGNGPRRLCSCSRLREN